MKSKLNRRSALQKVSYLVGGVVATPTLLSVMNSCRQSPPAMNWTPQYLNPEQSRLVTSLTELILPRTETPGAIDAGVPEFVDKLWGECLASEAQAVFTEGLDNLQSMAREEHGSEFQNLDINSQTELLNQTAKETADELNQSGQYGTDPKAFFKQLKQLTLLGYFNSEMGATQALAFVQIPGSYDGCIPMEPGQKEWAE